ncbi:uncharacterized protein KY384_002832 [Bacidia gigantensis]|uniref:uncharacterized protein n=1 Tax=Bacidia gigantensis TaxID=2732470 RepID=UPI001D0546C5|nr:uncharacterized protein KY384_002832 [Bacidia gigantensis]KAG8532347.1 hypothetical protein KY384_002832 [Bacidia gigantensis]
MAGHKLCSAADKQQGEGLREAMNPPLISQRLQRSFPHAEVQAGPDTPAATPQPTQPPANAANPTPAPSAPKPEDAIVNAVVEVFKSDVPLSDALVAGLRKGQTLSTTVDQIVSSTPTSTTWSSAVWKATSARTFDRFAKSDNRLLPFLLRQAVAADLSVADVAIKFYTLSQGGKAASSENETSFQSNLFIAETAACLAGLIDRNEIPAEQNLKAGLLALLEAASQKGTSFPRIRATTLLDSGSVSVNIDIRSSVVESFEDIQRLANLVRLPHQIAPLLRAKYKSAYSIAQTPVATFIQAVTTAGLPIDDARRVHDFATTIEIRNEQAWAGALQDRNDSLMLPAAPTTAPAPNPPTIRADPNDKTINLTNLFNDMDSIECADCSSVTSPSAYFVDLLRFLQETKEDMKALASPSLFALLIKRRPDLRYLQLSCANTNNTIPYLDLVNELLEYFVLNVNGKVPNMEDEFAKFNSQAKDSGKVDSQQPQNLNRDVYQNHILRQTYPFPQLPYNHNIDTARVILEALGTTRETVLTIFGTDEASITNVSPWKRERYTALERSRVATEKRIATSRAIATESLGLIDEDFFAITGEGLESIALFRAYWGGTQDVSYDKYRSFFDPKWTENLTPAGYWGYRQDGQNSPLTLMLDDKNGTGLTFIKRQLLPRSGLLLAELLEILGTQFIARRLTIVAETPDGAFTDEIDNMRLKTTSLVDPTSNKLTESICNDLQAFIRLRKRTGIATTELDSIISSSIRADYIPSNNFSITPKAIEDLAAARQLSVLASLSLSELQPLWSTMDTNGPKSLYARLFYSTRLTAQDPVFSVLGKGETPAQLKISEHRTVIMSALGLNDKDLDNLIDAAGLKPADNLSIKTISLLYRVNILRSIFGVKITDCSQLYSITSSSLDSICQGPQQTLQYLKQWQEIIATGLTTEDLNQIIPTKSYTPPQDPMISFSVRLSTGLAAVERTYPLRKDEATGFEEVQKAVALVFESSVVPTVMGFIEGTSTISYDVKSLKASSLATIIPARLTFDSGKAPGEGRLNLTGLLDTRETKLLLDFTSEEPELKKAVAYMTDASRKTFDLIRLRLQIPEADAERTFATDPLDEEARKTRRLLVLSFCIPVLRYQLARQLVLDLLAAEFSGVDPAALLIIVTAVIKTTGEGATQITALDSLRGLCDLQPDEKAFSGYFIPPTTNAYVFVSKSLTSKLAVDGQMITPENVGGERKFTTSRLLNGRSYRFSYTGNLAKEMRFMPKDGLVQLTLPLESLLDERIVTAVQSIYRSLVATTRLSQVFKMTAEEIQYFHRGKNIPLTYDFNDMSFRGLRDLVTYYNLRQSISPTSSDVKSNLLSLFAFCKDNIQTNDPRTIDQLYEKISGATGWPLKIVQQIMVQKYSNKTLDWRIALFRGFEELKSLQDVISLSQRLTSILPSLEISTMFGLATRKSFTRLNPHLYESLSAEKLRLATMSVIDQNEVLRPAIDTLREHRRTALLAYILNHPAVKKLGIINEDSLFEYLLIDVQMGPQLLTSRMKQAISTIHLFVQRCLLGLEIWNLSGPDPNAPKLKVRSDIVSKVRWSYLSQYTLWEANRKIFLYPENWIDPVLRDNKTDVFKQFETSLQSNNLDKDSIFQAVKSYVYEVNELAHLEYQTYIWEFVDDSVNKYHFFARTKHEPYEYYYRMFKYTKLGARWISRWDSWMKIDIDIVSQDADFDGSTIPGKGAFLVPAIQKGRLYLFLPQVVIKTSPVAAPTPVAMKGMWNEPKNDPLQRQYWEIRLAWTELRNQKWTPKQMSQEALKISSLRQPIGNYILPPLASIRFWATRLDNTTPNAATDDTLIIAIESWYEARREVIGNLPVRTDLGEKRAFEYNFPITKPSSRWGLGAFKIIGSEVTVSDYDPPNNLFVCSYFYKVSAKVGTAPQDKVGLARYFPNYRDVYDKTVPPNTGGFQGNIPILLALPNDVKTDNENFSWTMSMNVSWSRVPTALLMEQWVSGKSQTIFSVFTKPADEKVIAEDHLQISHPYAFDLMERSTRADDIYPIYQFLSSVKAPASGDKNLNAYHAYGALDPKAAKVVEYAEQACAQSLYVWELSLHIVMLLMEKLLSTQQFELALDIARLVFDPREEGDSLQRCWKFFPFKNPEMAKMGTVKESLSNKPGDAGNEALIQWKENPFSPHAVARGRPMAYMKRIVMKYIEILIANGDDFFRRNTLESIPLAIQRYAEASQLFGPRPRKIPPLGSKTAQTFAQLDKSFNSFSNAAVKMELEFPYTCDPRNRGATNAATALAKGQKPNPFMGFAKTTYFCVPANPKMMELRDLIDDRLLKIRNSMDINGKARSLQLWEPPIDAGVLVQAQAAGISSSLLLTDLDAPMPNYRFLYLLQKAFELCAELKSMGESFLAAKEKRDAEAFSLLTARQAVVSETMLIDVKLLQKTEAEKSIAVLEETRKSHEMRLSYHLELTGESLSKVPNERTAWQDLQQAIDKPSSDDLRMSSYEKTEMNKADSAADLTEKASVMDAIAAGLMALPNLTTTVQPMGVGMMMKIDAENIAKFMQGTAVVLKLKAEMDSFDSQRAARKATLIRQLQERRLQANLAGHDIKSLDKELEVSRVRLALCNKDIEVQKKQAEQAKEVQTFYQSKYTNEKLYTWMENTIRSAYYDTYLAAMQIAKKAEKSFLFEHPLHRNRTSHLAQTGFWDSGRDGLLSAHNLYLSLKRLEATYHEKRSHDFELVKNVSLRQISPAALLTLRETGKAEFTLPEVLFDMDFPGHFMRRIKTVSVSMPCLIGPYCGTNCTVTLLEHRTRVSGKKGDNYDDQGREDTRFRTDRVPISCIAISSGQSDTGTFELNINDERYLPFEGAGVISKWRLEFPSEIRQFDYDTISDVILHVRYTSIAGGSALQKAANASVKGYLKTVSELDLDKGGVSVLLDLKNDFPNEWFNFASIGEPFALAGLRDRLPFWTRAATNVVVKSVYLIVSSAPIANDAGVETRPDLVNLVEGEKMKFEAPSSEARLKKSEVIPMPGVGKGMGVFEVEKVAGKVDRNWKLKFRVQEKRVRDGLGGLWAVVRYAAEYKV